VVAFARGLAQFRANPLRTLLTLLGIVFGVASVVAMVSIGRGAQRQILAGIEAMGATSVHVLSRPVEDEEVGEVIDGSAGLSRADLRALRDLLPDLRAGVYQARHDLRVTDLPRPAHDIEVITVGPGLMAAHGLALAQGRGLREVDHTRRQRVAVLGADLAREVHGGAPLGQQIRLDYAYFDVVGVLAPTSGGGSDLPIDPQVFDDAVIIPFSTAESELAPPAVYAELEMLTLQVDELSQTLATKQLVEPALLSLHGGHRDFEVIAPEEVLAQRQGAQAVLNAVLISIAAISLLVGGIGVMNIMLANIMERIPEIGLKRAVGARRRDIRDQFMVEAVTICVVGGIIGIALGLVISGVVSVVADLPVALAWESMVAAFGISILVGLASGLIPALRAASIDPIEALHHG